MDAIKLTFGGVEGLGPETADGRAVLRVLSAYLEAIGLASDHAKLHPPAFGLPVFGSGSLPSLIPVRDNPESVRRGAAKVVDVLRGEPAPRGLGSAISELRDAVLSLPETMTLVANGLGPPVDLCAHARGVGRPTMTGVEDLRVVVRRAGGSDKSTTIRFRSEVDKGAFFTLRASRTLTQMAGAHLFNLVAIRATVTRATDNDDLPVLGGSVEELRPLGVGPSFEDLKRWYDGIAQHGEPEGGCG